MILGVGTRSRLAGAGRLTGALAVCAALLAVHAAGARAALTYDASPLHVAPGRPLTNVACPSAAECVATAGAQELTFDPLALRHPVPHAMFTGRGLVLDGLWCPSTTLCVGIDFQSETAINPRRFRPRPPAKRIEPITGEGLVSVRCPSHSECVAIDSFGDAITFNPLTRSILKRRIEVEPDERLTALACPSTTQCTELDDNGSATTFQPRSGRIIARSHIDPAVGLDAPSGGSDNELDGISCPTARLCAAVDRLGNVLTFNPQLGGTTGALATTTMPVDPSGSLSSISCKKNGLCVTVDRSGNAVAGSATANSWQLQAVDPGHAFNAVACPTDSECVAVDSAGDAFRLYPTLS